MATRPKPAPPPKRTTRPQAPPPPAAESDRYLGANAEGMAAFAEAMDDDAQEAKQPREADPAPAETLQYGEGASALFHPANMDIVRALWYGDPGVGKTTAMLTLANVGRIVVWDAERRLKQAALRRAGVNVDNIERLVDVSYQQMSDTLDDLQDRDDIIGVCFDGATELVRVLVQHLVDEGVKVAFKKGYERAAWRTYVEDYGDVAEQFRRLMRKALRLPLHFGMTTLSQRTEDEEKRIHVSPLLTPAVARDVNSAMDVITFLRVDELNDTILRSGLFIPGGRHDTKDTFGLLPRRLANPTFERMLWYVSEAVNADIDLEQQEAAEAVARSIAEAAPDT